MAYHINGVGTIYYGHRDRLADSSYVTTKWVVFLFLPVIPLGDLSNQNREHWRQAVGVRKRGHLAAVVSSQSCAAKPQAGRTNLPSLLWVNFICVGSRAVLRTSPRLVEASTTTTLGVVSSTSHTPRFPNDTTTLGFGY